MDDDSREEVVSVVTDYRIAWKQEEGRQDAIDLLIRSAGGGGGCGAGKHGLYRASAVSKPRIMQPTLTDAERGAVLAMACHCDTRSGLEWVRLSATLRGLLERLGGGE